MGIWSDDSKIYENDGHHCLRVDITDELRKNPTLFREVAPDANIEDYLLKSATSGNYEGRPLHYFIIFIYQQGNCYWLNLRSCRWGPLLHVCARRPPSTWTEIFPSMCLQSHLQTTPQTPLKSYQKFHNLRTTFLNTPFSTHPWNIFRVGIWIFLLIWSSCKIQHLLLWEWVNCSERNNS